MQNQFQAPPSEVTDSGRDSCGTITDVNDGLEIIDTRTASRVDPSLCRSRGSNRFDGDIIHQILATTVENINIDTVLSNVSESATTLPNEDPIDWSNVIAEIINSFR